MEWRRVGNKAWKAYVQPKMIRSIVPLDWTVRKGVTGMWHVQKGIEFAGTFLTRNQAQKYVETIAMLEESK